MSEAACLPGTKSPFSPIVVNEPLTRFLMMGGGTVNNIRPFEGEGRQSANPLCAAR
jgi:hypothetical protein